MLQINSNLIVIRPGDVSDVSDAVISGRVRTELSGLGAPVINTHSPPHTPPCTRERKLLLELHAYRCCSCLCVFGLAASVGPAPGDRQRTRAFTLNLTCWYTSCLAGKQKGETGLYCYVFHGIWEQGKNLRTIWSLVTYLLYIRPNCLRLRPSCFFLCLQPYSFPFYPVKYFWILS